jgi:DNA replication protein DnaC
MRTEESWNTQWKLKMIRSKFTPRLANDLLKLPMPIFDDFIDSTFIFGEIQSGKTVRAAQMMLMELQAIYLGDETAEVGSCIFVSFPDLLAEIRATYGKNDKSEKEVMDKYMNAHLLLLDDFMTTRPSDWVIDILYHLINHRYEYMKKTIITSNLSLEDLEEKLGDQRITSRINRMCAIEHKTHWNKK